MVIFFSLLIFVGLAPACGSLPELPILQPATSTPESTLIVPTPTPTVTEPADSLVGPITLVIWLPPQFDPADGTEAGTLLQQRLEEYAELHPGLRVMVRLKDETGPASLLKSLHAASQAAPLALPDLVVLSTRDMANATDTNLIYPYPAGYPDEDDLDWYEAAEQLGTYENQQFGLPFAANALVMAYKINEVEEVPTSWENLLNSGYLMTFPAADPQARFSLAGYLSSGGVLMESGQVAIEEQPLTDLLNFYAQARENDIIPFWLTQYDTDDLSWPTFSEGTAELAITWATRFFQERNESIGATILPTQSGEPFTLANGWVWSISTQDPNRQAAAAELASFLSASEFVSGWTQAADYLPLRPTALADWEQSPNQRLAGQLLPVAHAFPPPSTTLQVSPPLTEAVIAVLKDEQSPQEAVEQVLAAIGQ